MCLPQTSSAQQMPGSLQGPHQRSAGYLHPTRYFVLLVLELKTRRVKISGIHHQPHGEWMEQMAADSDGRGRGLPYVREAEI